MLSNSVRGSKIHNVLPGDKLATIEEFVAGEGATVYGDSVVSTVLGLADPDMSNRVINVKATKNAALSLPNTGDHVTGIVQSAQSSIAQVKIVAVNEVTSEKELTGMLSLRDERRRRTSPVRTGDAIRAKVISTRNSIFHLALDSPTCGVLYTVCSVCGRDVFSLGQDRVKCKECGYVEERILSEDFVKFSRSQEKT